MSSYNPEKRAWRGKSYKKGGERIADLRDNKGWDKDPSVPCPDDYEPCGTCGFDHSYDLVNQSARRDSNAAHAEAEGA